MDRTARIPEAAVRWNLVWLVFLGVAASSCEHNQTVGRAGAPTGSSLAVPTVQSTQRAEHTQMATSKTSQPAESGKEPSQAEVDRAVDRFFAQRTQYTEAELKVISYVERYMVTSGTPFPSPRKYLLSKTSDGWNVTLVDVESLRRGDRPMDLTLHVRETSGGLEAISGTVR